MVRRVKQEKPEKGDVLEMAEERMDFVFEEFDTVFIAFSGGKDSGTLLNLAREAYDRHPEYDKKVHLVHIDDEVIPPETEEFVKDAGRDDRFKLWWFCLPVAYSNGCSTEEPYWFTFNPERRDKWVREPPHDWCGQFPDEEVELVTLDHWRVQEEMDDFKNWSFTDPEKNDFPGRGSGKRPFAQKDLNYLFFHRFNQSDDYPDIDYGTVGNCVGIRTSESLTRLRALLKAKSHDHGGDTRYEVPWIVQGTAGFEDFYTVKPIYDWKGHDVWNAHGDRDWPYNGAYDKLAMMDVPRSEWRTAQPYGTEPLKGLYWFRKCWPELWHRAKGRVPGAKAASQWGWDLYQAKKREDRTWKETAEHYLAGLRDEAAREYVSSQIQNILDRHNQRSSHPLPQDQNCPHCEWSWKKIAKKTARGVEPWKKGNI